MKGLRHLSDRIRQSMEQRRLTPERAFALRAEDQAHRFLERRGYRVVARNYRTLASGNEIDLVAWDGPSLVFIEVKARRDSGISAPERAVTPEKQQRIARAAADYARRAKVEWSAARFDVVAITGLRNPQIELFRDAFGAAPGPR